MTSERVFSGLWMNSAGLAAVRQHPDMGTVRLDAAAVRTLADRMLDEAARLSEIHWPTMASDALPGSSFGAATTCTVAEDRLADLAAHLRSWASAVRAAVAAVEQAELNVEDRLEGAR